MLWKEVKSWCKKNGFYADRKKQEDIDNSYVYTWYKESDTSISGTTTSVSKLASIIYNTITDNKYLKYQQEFKDKKNTQDIEHIKQGWS
jgi:hypothetical protein